MSQVGALAAQLTPEDEENISKLALTLMSDIAPHMRDQVVHVEDYLQQLRPYLRILITSPLRIVPTAK